MHLQEATCVASRPQYETVIKGAKLSVPIYAVNAAKQVAGWQALTDCMQLLSSKGCSIQQHHTETRHWLMVL